MLYQYVIFVKSERVHTLIPLKETQMKLMIVGHGRHGKDEVCKILQKKGYSFSSSSEFANELFIFEDLKEKYGYKTLEECFEDRVNKRTEWHDLICEYNREDPARLARKIYEENDVYAGIRNPIEFDKAKEEGLFQASIWVDASKRLENEPVESNKMSKEKCDYILDNNGPLNNLEEEVEKVLQNIHKDQEEELAMRNYSLKLQKDQMRKNLMKLLAPKMNVSKTKGEKLTKLFDALDELAIHQAEAATEMLMHEWPLMEQKLETLQELAYYFDNKYILTKDPSKSTKKEIVDNVQFFSLENLISNNEKSNEKEDEKVESFDEIPELNDEAKQGFQSVQD